MPKTITESVEEAKDIRPFEERAKEYAERTTPIAEELGVAIGASFATNENTIAAIPVLKDAFAVPAEPEK